MELKQIGVINTPYKTLFQTPKVESLDKGIFCELTIFDDYLDGLLDIEKASHLIVFYWLDKADRNNLQGVSPLDKKLHGVFATRNPNRPNPIGISVVKFIERVDNVLIINDISALDNTPLLDIKPYIAKTDLVKDSKLIWFDNVNNET